MNLLIPVLNIWSGHALAFAWPMLWQSSLLIGLLFTADLLLKRKLRPAVRYALWLVVLVKLLVPPTLAFPASAGWWLRPARTTPAPFRPAVVTVSYPVDDRLPMPTPDMPVFVAPAAPRLSSQALMLVGMAALSLGLLAWMLVRWVQVVREARQAAPAPAWLLDLLPERRRPVRVRLTEHPQSPAVCGLFRPVILLPRSLTEQLPPAQLRAVLLHELLHLRRGDVWVNCLQALLQIVYWWHPLLWFANANIRRVREEAVDDAVMLALNEEAESYAPTLVEVAKLALHRPMASLGLVGILESRSALRQRIERLVEFRPPRRAGLTTGSALAVLGFAALAVPMEQAPAPSAAGPAAATQVVTNGLASHASTNRPGSPEQAVEAAVLSEAGKILYEMRRFDEAEAKLQQALALDPQKQSAGYYLQLVRETQYRTNGGLRKLPPQHKSDSGRDGARVGNDRREIVNALNEIRLDRVSFDAQPLSEVTRFLAGESRRRDPKKRGVNMIINPAEPSASYWEALLDPTKSQPDPAATAPPKPLAELPITIEPPLTNLRLIDALDAIVRVAPQPLRWSVESYGVVFSPRITQPGSSLSVRTFRVAEYRLIAGLLKVPGLVDPDATGSVVPFLSKYIAQAGVDMDPVRHPGKALFYSDSRGMLVVRATEQDLDVIAGLINALSPPPPQINIRCKFVEVSQDDGKALGFDWYLGNVIVGPGATGLSNGAPAAPSAPTASAGGTATPDAATLSGILTDPQYRVVIKALAQRQAAKVVAQPEVTTVSGRRATLKDGKVRTIVKGVKEKALTPPGITGTNVADSAVLDTEEMDFGLTLDITPTVLEDGYTISVPSTASLLEFLGYEDTRTNLVTAYVNGKKKQVAAPRPILRTCQVSSQANVQDGQTLVLSGLVTESIVTTKSGVPVLGDIPVVGRLFRSQSSDTEKRNLLVFITPTIIDPAGNRVHEAK